ncbi:hypothetical protein [Sphingomonas radiodurans]|uniref:hypothetical protein n=1 Tax=Sphingomonas radiodurans TaxID=2890321 RepID=UPI001E465DD8|nr:hypothetical protein [Sphingomonas radiodurans]WBH15802.1 hypothetical protein LLW23_13395 [Sphingomonas radiodurans]
MVAGLKPPTVARIAPVAALVALAFVAPRLALLAALLASVYWIARRDDDVGTWGVLYVVLLLILGILTSLVAGLAFLHRLLGA